MLAALSRPGLGGGGSSGGGFGGAGGGGLGALAGLLKGGGGGGQQAAANPIQSLMAAIGKGMMLKDEKERTEAGKVLVVASFLADDLNLMCVAGQRSRERSNLG